MNNFEDILKKANPNKPSNWFTKDRLEKLELVSKLQTAISDITDILNDLSDKDIIVEGYINCFDNYDLDNPNKISRFSNINPLSIGINRIFETTEHWHIWQNRLKKDAFGEKNEKKC